MSGADDNNETPNAPTTVTAVASNNENENVDDAVTSTDAGASLLVAQPSAGAALPATTHSDRADCHFYLSGMCNKGAACEYRHSPHARYATVPCKFWLAGKCSKADCAFLHPPQPVKKAFASGFASPVDHRSITPCYWLTQPGGCSKGSACPYLHPNATPAKRYHADTSVVTWGAAPPKKLAELDAHSRSKAQSILARASLTANAAENVQVTFSRKQARTATDSGGAVRSASGDLRDRLKRAKKPTPSDDEKPAAAKQPPSAKPAATSAAAGSGSFGFVKKFSEIMATADSQSASQPSAGVSADAATPATEADAAKASSKRKLATAATTAAKPTTERTAAPPPSESQPQPPPPTPTATTTTTEQPPTNVKKAKVASSKVTAPPPPTEFDDDELDADLAAIDELLA